MSINWVMIGTSGEAFVKLPNEQVLFKSNTRTSFEITSPNPYPGAQPFSLKTDSGVTYVTNQRVVYIPATPSKDLQSFSSPILNLQDACVRAPWFGANYWVAVVKPVAGGNIPSHIPVIEIRMTFKEGGAYDFHSVYERIKEQLYHAVQLAREEGRNVSRNPMGTVDLANVHLDQLPAYEAESTSNDGLPTPTGLNVAEADHSVSESAPGIQTPSTPEAIHQTFTPPNEPPPGYEEAQMHAVSIDLDQRLRDEAERQ